MPVPAPGSHSSLPLSLQLAAGVLSRCGLRWSDAPLTRKPLHGGQAARGAPAVANVRLPGPGSLGASPSPDVVEEDNEVPEAAPSLWVQPESSIPEDGTSELVRWGAAEAHPLRRGSG